MPRPLMFVLWLAAACGSASQPATPSTSSGADVSAATDEGGFGGEGYGFVEAWSANGRFVALRRFTREGPPEFSHHGGVLGGTTLVVIDRTTGEERAASEIVDLSTDRRYWLLLDEQGISLLDSASGASIALGPAEGDGNSCLAPRQAAFSPHGLRVAWIAVGSREVTIRDLASGEQWSLASEANLWRVWPDDQGRGATVFEVAADATGWPEQRTSCECRWCVRFAASYGFYGWGGAAFTIAHLDGAGGRTELDEPPELHGAWTGPTEDGCTIEASSENRGVERGPWRLRCPR